MSTDSLVIDHALWGGRDLESMVAAFTDLGLEPVAGGEHQHDITHNALLGFDDGSYIELIAPRNPNTETKVRNAFFQGEAGPSGWAVAVSDIDAEVRRLEAAGIPVDGPEYHERETPDGQWIEWEVAYPGGGEPGRTLPFLIEDHTPRDRRIQPSPSVTGSPLNGIASLVIGVQNLDEAVSEFERGYDLDAPRRAGLPSLDIDLAVFSDAPVKVSAPSSAGNWLDERLERFGELPWGILLETTDFERAIDRYDLSDAGTVADQRVAWFPIESPSGGRLGAVEA